VSTIQFGRGREVWAEVEPFLLLGRVSSASPTPVVGTARPPRKSRSTADLVLLPHEEVQP